MSNMSKTRMAKTASISFQQQNKENNVRLKPNVKNTSTGQHWYK